MLQKLINPQSIAIVGASEDLTKPGGRIVRNILLKGFTGQLFAVNPKGGFIQGVQTYPSVRDLPAAPDLAFIAVAAKFVRASVEDLCAMGTPVVVVLSAGFGELNAEGKLEEQRLAEIASQHGTLLLGPNCSGIMTYAHASKFAGLVPDMYEDGIDFISGSGASIDFLAEHALRRGLRFRSFITFGNAAQSGVADILALLDEDYGPDSSQVKLLYMESLADPQKFLKHARSLTQKGCVLGAIKSGTTQDGSRAAASHTGSMASNDVAVQALMEKAGVIRLSSRLELVDVANALVGLKGKYDGRRACVITDAGGPGVMLADELNRQGFELPALSERTQERLRSALLPGASVGNPVDCLPTRSPAMLAQVFQILDEEEYGRIDYLLVIDGDSGLADPWEIYQVIANAMDQCRIPILVSINASEAAQPGLERFRQMGKCYYEDEVALARALARVVNRPRLSEPHGELPNYDPDQIQACLTQQSGTLSPELVRKLLSAAGLSLPEQKEVTDMVALDAVDLPFPWVMKVIGPLHKSDVGGVRVGVRDLTQARLVWGELMSIDQAVGVLVQPMISGTEVIMGAQREAGFGHLVAFGLGGIYTEVLKDVKFSLAPLSHEEAHTMIRSIKAFPLIQGVRGQPGMDLDLLADWLVRIGRLLVDFQQIREMDLNPVKGQGNQIYAVDARMIVD